MFDHQPAVRLAFPAAERAYPWLAALLDAYLEIDRGVHAGLVREGRRGRRLACARGCCACCRTHLDIPVYPLELMGLYWYCNEALAGDLRQRLRTRLLGYAPGEPCPFLVDGACGIHPLRPMACRQFNVFDRPCAEGEDAFHTRRRDVMTPIRRYADAAFDRLLPFHGVSSRGERREAVASGRLHALAKPLQALEWRRLGERMGEAPDPRPASHPTPGQTAGEDPSRTPSGRHN